MWKKIQIIMNKFYKVEIYMDNIYQVISYYWDDETLMKSCVGGQVRTVEFQGTLAECDAYLSLREKGYIDE
jgi:hypothetical protein